MKEFIELVKEGFRLAANLVMMAGKMAFDAVKTAVLAYFNQVKEWTLRFAIWAAVPLVVVVPCLLFKLQLSPLYAAYTIWVALLLVAELLLLTPAFLIWRRVKPLFPGIVKDLEEWGEFIKVVGFNGLSFAVFIMVFPIWRNPSAFLVLLLVIACWFLLPTCGFNSFCKRVYPTLSAIQLIGLVGLLMFQMAFPRHMEQLNWATGKKIGGVLTRSVEQKEISSEWRSLQWFSNQGEPQVWFSGSEGEGFRLWAAPGFDQATGRELQAVTDATVQNRIVANLTERANRASYLATLNAETQRRQAQAEKDRQAVAEAEKGRVRAMEAEVQRQQEQAEKQRQAVADAKKASRDKADQVRMAAAETKRLAELAEAQKREYVARNLRTTATLKSPGKLSLAVGVANGEGNLDEATSMQLAAFFPEARVKAAGNVFKPAFAADGVLNKLLTSDNAEMVRLGLPALTDHLLLGSYRIQFITNAQLDGIITARLQFDGTILKSETGVVQEKLNVEMSGAGFGNDLAESAAKERLIKSLSTRPWRFLAQ